MASPTEVTVAGYNGCAFFSQAQADAKRLGAGVPGIKITVLPFSRPKYLEFAASKLKPKGIVHETSPAVWLGSPDNGQFIGGASDFAKFLKSEYPDLPAQQAEGGCCIVQ